MGVKVRVKRGRLYLDVYHQGRRHWEALGLQLGQDEATNRDTLRMADICRQKRELQIATGEWGLLDQTGGKRALLDYARELAAPMNPKNHLPKALRYLEAYGGGVRLAAVTERWIEGFQAHLLGAGLARVTASHYAAAVRQVLTHAVRDLLIPRNPAVAVRTISVPETVKTYLTPEELDRLTATPLGGTLGAEVKRAFLFAACTGLRISDLRGLTWGAVDRSARQLVKPQAKTGRVVAVPMNSTAWGLIQDERLHRQDEPVFPALAASKANTNQYLTAWAARAGVDKDIGWHTARHTFATLTLDAGADVSTVSRMLGHTKLATTAVYAKTTDRAKRAAVDALPVLDLNTGERGRA